MIRVRIISCGVVRDLSGQTMRQDFVSFASRQRKM
jgi:hypothetical protein